ncbi:hypothetical protein LDE02_01730 [Lactobacillus delbrueckii subsp. lactis]|nr:hypothetical protein LDE02_01730 [Lactobacillus delbrueckii subsp. lactis]
MSDMYATRIKQFRYNNISIPQEIKILVIKKSKLLKEFLPNYF